MRARYHIYILLSIFQLGVANYTYTQTCEDAKQLIRGWEKGIKDVQAEYERGTSRDVIEAKVQEVKNLYPPSISETTIDFISTASPRVISTDQFLKDLGTWTLKNLSLAECTHCVNSNGEPFITYHVNISYFVGAAKVKPYSKNLIIDIKSNGRGTQPFIYHVGILGNASSNNFPCRENPNPPKEPSSPVVESPNPGLPSPNPIGNPQQCDCDALNRQINNLNGQISTLNGQIRQKDSQIIILKRDTIQKGVTIQQQKKSIDSLNQLVIVLRDSIQDLQNILDCIQALDTERKARKRDARAQLEFANLKYTQYKEFKLRYQRMNPKPDLKGMLDTIWGIYATYGTYCVDTECMGYPVSYCDDYKNAREHLNVALIIANNPEYVTNVMDGANLCQKVSQMNTLIMSELGLATQKSSDPSSLDYETKVDMERLIDLLPVILVPEKRCDDFANDQNSVVWRSINAVKKLYDEGDFAGAISLYSRFQRFFELKEFETDEAKQMIADAKYAAGAIMLWNLGETTEQQGLFVPGSWLFEKIDAREATGETLLNEVANDENADITIRKAAFTILNKRVIHKNRS